MMSGDMATSSILRIRIRLRRIFDLLPFLVKSARTYPVQCDDCVDWLYNYFRYFPLKEDELLLMQSYLAFPGSALELVKGYSDGRAIVQSLIMLLNCSGNFGF
ncbi:hypothetical protein RCO48_26170 [Peribacillus frigoritolerans]|nr:hypothetical protein [Peribacillus frigoritolerans]